MSIKRVLQKGWAGVQGYVTAPGHYSSDHPVIRSSLNFFHFPMPPGGWGHKNNLSIFIQPAREARGPEGPARWEC